MTNREGLKPKMIWRALTNWYLWPLYLIGILFGLPAGPVQQYLTLSLKQLGFSTLLTQVLSSVQYIASVFTGIAIVVAGELLEERVLVCMGEDLWCLPFLIAILGQGTNVSPWTYYGLATGLLSNPYVHPIQASLVSANSGDVQTRTVAASIYNICVQAGAIIYSNIYQASDAPRYVKGNVALVAICCLNVSSHQSSAFRSAD